MSNDLLASLLVFWLTLLNLRKLYGNNLSYEWPKSKHWNVLAQQFLGLVGNSGQAEISTHLEGVESGDRARQSPGH